MSNETPTVAGFIERTSGFIADGFRYWEPRRIFYNAVLAVVVIAHLVTRWNVARGMLSSDLFLGLFLLAVLANICYCAVYPIDLFVRFSGLDAAWEKGRVVLLLIGTAFAAVIAHFFSWGMFIPGLD